VTKQNYLEISDVTENGYTVGHTMATSAKDSALISGVVAILQIRIEDPSAGSDSVDDEYLFRMALEMRGKLRHDIEAAVTETLGPEFEIHSLDISPGSAHLLIAISAATAFFMTFSRYESFVKSVNLLVSQVTGIVRRVIGSVSNGQREVEVRSTWSPMTPITSAHHILSPSNGIDMNRLLIFYLIASHAVLLVFVLWLLASHLK